jgi:hypothetical protein
MVSASTSLSWFDWWNGDGLPDHIPCRIVAGAGFSLNILIAHYLPNFSLNRFSQPAPKLHVQKLPKPGEQPGFNAQDELLN